jgi:hypothetical protein
VVAAAVLAAIVPVPPRLVENVYSNGLYLPLQNFLTAFSNLVPVALFDVLVLAGLGGLLFWWATALIGAGEKKRRLWARAFGTIVAAAFLYLAFLGAWGLNYRREPLRERLDFSAERVTAPALAALSDRAVAEMNSYHSTPEREDWPPLSDIPGWLEPAFHEAQRELGMTRLARAARPKTTLLGPYFRATRVDGMMNPFLHETLVNETVLPFERPFLVAHEWAHLAGFADEAEANFLAWLICLRGDDRSRYSAWLSLYPHLLFHLDSQARATSLRSLMPGVAADLRSVSQRLSGASPRMQRVSAGVYDRYLKANRVSRGIRSYDGVVALVLGTRFGHEWTPVTRSPAVAGASVEATTGRE